MSDSTSPAEPRKTKPSLFKRPTWAAKSTATVTHSPDPATTNLFDRSETFDSIVAERERKRLEKNAKKKVKEEKKRSSDTHSLQDTPEGKSGSKRRRISDLDDELLDISDADDHGDEFSAQPQNVDLVSRRYDEVPAVTKPKPQTRTQRSKAPVIEIGSDGDEDSGDDVPHSTSKLSTTPPVTRVVGATALQSPQSDSESDPELAELKRKARQKRRLEEEAEKERARAQEAYGDGYGTLYPGPAIDPRIQILVTSPIPNTSPLIVSRRLSQRLQEVKEAWFSRQNFPPDFHISNVFFTYRLSKVYDVTACKSLGIKVDSDGKIIPDNQSWADEDETGVGGEHEGKVHLEAMTEELFHKMRAAKRGGRHGSSAMIKAGTEGPDAEGTPMEGGEDDADKEQLIRITLKAKGFKDAKLKVKPSTAYSRITNAARQLFGKQKPIPADQSLVLVFDGETLEPPDGLIRDTDIEDKDGVEVHFR